MNSEIVPFRNRSPLAKDFYPFFEDRYPSSENLDVSLNDSLGGREPKIPPNKHVVCTSGGHTRERSHNRVKLTHIKVKCEAESHNQKSHNDSPKRDSPEGMGSPGRGVGPALRNSNLFNL
jgi:hypothetical protein